MAKTYFQIEKRYYDPSDFNAPMLTDNVPILFSALDEAKAYYARSTDPWFEQGEDPFFAVSEIEPSGYEVGYHSLPQRVSA